MPDDSPTSQDPATVATRFATGLLTSAAAAELDATGRVRRAQNQTSGLALERREVVVTVTGGGDSEVPVAVRLRSRASRGPAGGGVEWSETHVLRVRGGAVVALAPELPLGRLEAMAAGRAPRWMAPPRRASTRAAAGVVAALARHGGSTSAPAAEVVHRYVEQFKNAQRFSVFPQLFAPGFRHHFDFPGRGAGLESFMAVGREVLGAFSNVHVDLLDLVAEDDLVLERNAVTACHRRPFGGAPGTGRPVAWTETHLYRVPDGRIVENWPAVDFAGLAASL